MSRAWPSGGVAGVVLGITAGALAAALAGCPTPAGGLCNSDDDCEAGLVCELGACSHSPEQLPDAGEEDGGAEDAGVVDAGADDAGADDAGAVDAGTDDAGAVDAGPADAGGCPPLTHDGGDGSCLPLGSCSAGYALYFPDTDEDGVGAGAPSEDCAALPLALGLSDIDGDCAPGDRDRFQEQPGFDDRDLDSYTAGATQACVGDVPEQGIVDQERGPPHLAFAAAAASLGVSNAWSSPGNTTSCCGGTSAADLDPAAATAVLALSDFTCLAEPPQVDLVRVRAHARLPAGQAATLETQVTLLEDGTAGPPRSVTTAWTAAFASVVLEAPAADWGIGAPDAATLCAGALDAQVVIAPNGSYGGNVEIDYVVVELLGGADCDTGSPALFAPLSMYADGDDDGYAGGPPLAGCIGDAVLTAWGVLEPLDCDDTDVDAHPDQTSYFTSPRNGGGWDYDCNGADDKRSVTDANGCSENVDAGSCAVTGTTSRSGDCGAQVDADDCPAAPACTLIEDTDAIACR